MTDQTNDVPAPTTEEASTNFYWTFGKVEVFNLQTTIRGALQLGQVAQHLDAVTVALKAVVSAGGHAKSVGRDSGPVTTAVAPAKAAPAQETTAGPIPGKVPAPVVAAAGNGGAAVQVLMAEKMEVEPRSDGKANVKFYMAGHRFPDIITTRSPETLASLLQMTGAWTPEHFKVAETYPVNMRVEWTPGKLNSKGVPYKDLVAIHPVKQAAP